MNRASVAMTERTENALRARLLRDDGQEDLCLATYRRSTGASRMTALVRKVIAPSPGDRLVHGNVTVTADYVLRAAEIAQSDNCGLVLLHSHPRAGGWQPMSGPDRDTEASYANLVREITGLPLVGMTLAGGDGSWSARHWDIGVGAAVAPSLCENVRVIGEQLRVSWNDRIVPLPPPNAALGRTVSAWGPLRQADLARRRILVVGVGSVGLDVATRLAASGIDNLSVMDFDIVEAKNRDRLIGATRRDAVLVRPKIYIAQRETRRAATSDAFTLYARDLSICEPAGLAFALDHDLIFCCVDRPWPRAVLNAVAYTDLIPVIDGGIAIDTVDARAMRNATWRSHVIRPGRPCMVCNGQLDPAKVALEIQGLLDDPEYIEATEPRSHEDAGANVATLSVSVTAALLAQYTSLSVAPGGFGDPGALQYILSTHHLERLDTRSQPHCPYESDPAIGDRRIDLTGKHPAAARRRRDAAGVPFHIEILRSIDRRLSSLESWLDRR